MFSRIFLILSLMLVVSACAGSAPDSDSSAQEETSDSQAQTVTMFTMSKKCADGSIVYQVDGVGYATWDGSNNQWIKLSPGVTPSDFCE